MEVVYYNIALLSGGRAFFLRQVCSQFRRLLPKVDYLDYLEELYEQEQEAENFVPSKELLHWAVQRNKFYILDANLDLLDEDICDHAAYHGHLDLLQWLIGGGFQPSYNTFKEAVRGGHLEILQWLKKEGYPWSSVSFCVAVVHGHKHILRWCKEINYGWDWPLCNEAAQVGDLEMLQWLRSESRFRFTKFYIRLRLI
ncbi:Ankyrin repeat-containing protein [Cedratvirus Zaza IHUMI]|uniref:Ankyrin repeat-containing protein n=1 Tax=Cedratvirus Zaza IHUMI TaxID=2126979 RepID=A0A2R8FFD2_9VIRU|nr:Ankyrin repeat-containing protein [Cedratvirus Zaza IHUMI]